MSAGTVFSFAIYAALPASFRRALPDLERARHEATAIGMREEFEDVYILGNDAMRERPGLPYEPRDIVRTLCKYHS